MVATPGEHCRVCGGPLDGASGDPCARCRQAAVTLTEIRPATPPAEPPDPLVGSTVGAYEVLAPAGQGGMGRVYKARHSRLDRIVALKVLPPGTLESPDRRRRFVREARSASKLAHANIVTVHDLVSAGGRDYLVMEYVDGPTLAEAIPEGGLPLDRALRYARQVASALAAAHRAGIVHRDLKPGNVMIAEGDQAKLMDFGLAKLTDAGDEAVGTAATALTRFGAVIGTVHYMSPEQAQGEPVDQRSDIFSFGVVLYEMLTGQRPFAARSRVEVMHAVVAVPPRPLVELRPEMPPALSAVVDRALAKRPEDRFGSAEELLAALGGDGLETGGHRAAAAARGPRLPGRLGGLLRPRGAALAIALVAAVAILSVPASRKALRSGAAAALSALAPARSENVTAPQAHELFQRGMAQLEDYRSRQSVEAARDNFQRGIAADPDHAASYAGLARAQWRLFQISKDPLHLEQARFSAEKALELDQHLSVARISHGLVSMESGKLDEAEADFSAVRALDPDNAGALRGLGEVAFRRGRMAQAEALYSQAIEKAPDDWELPFLLGWVYYRQGRYAEAEAQYRRTIELRPDAPAGYQTLAGALHMQGRYSEAAAALQKALEIHPTKPLYTNLGTLYFFQGLYANSVTAFERAIEMGANSYLDWANLGDAYRWTPGLEDKAPQAYRRAVQLLEAELAKSPGDPTLRSRLAVLLAKRGEKADARRLAKALETAGDDLDTSTRYRIALAYEIAGDRTSALAALRTALAHGYSPSEVARDPELTALRGDPAYQLLAGEFAEQAARS